MLAADPPALVQPAQTESQPDVIEVVGTRADQAQKIDRRTYRVQQNPHSAQKDSLQLLRGLPAVTITPDDQVQLLGSSGVTILVDGGPVHGDPRLFLRTLRGSDIERIEIITNPSAQYSSQGTAGVINFVLKKKREEGLSGSASNEASSFGAATTINAIRLKKGKWTYEAQVQGWDGGVMRSRYDSVRTVERSPGAAPTINTQEGHITSGFGFGSFNGTVTYNVADRTSLTALTFVGAYRGPTDSRTEWRGVTPDFQSFSERQHAADEQSYVGAQMSLNHRGRKEGETFQAFASVYGNPTQLRRVNGNMADGDPYSIDAPNSLFGNWAKVDWNHPIGKRSIFSAGSEWTFQRRGHDYHFATTDLGSALVSETSGRFQVKESKAVAWTTFQQPIGSWTMMPGLRVERLSRTVSSPGLPEVHVVRTDAFPTFHLQKPLTKTLNLTLSYSKRIARPGDDYLRPYPIITGALAISEGNPLLRDQSIDAYELNLHYRRKKLSAGLIVYNRETTDLWSIGFLVNDDGANVTRWLNAGRQSDRGAQIDLSTPVLRRVKAMTNVNLFASRVPVLGVDGLSNYESFRYTGNATLEWTGADRGDRPGDVRQLQFQYQSPARSFQTRFGSYYSLNFSWTHNLTRALSLTATVNRIGPNRYRYVVSAPLVQADTISRNRGPEFKLKLSKTFGAAKSPPSLTPPPVPIPQ